MTKRGPTLVTLDFTEACVVSIALRDEIARIDRVDPEGENCSDLREEAAKLRVRIQKRVDQQRESLGLDK